MTPRRPNKRNVKRKLDDLDPAEGDGYGGIWCRVTTAGDPDDPDDDGGIPAGKPTPDGGGKPDE